MSNPRKPPPRLSVMPGEGRRIRNDITLAVLAKGVPTSVPDKSYWRRRIKCGDCIDLNDPKNSKLKADAEAKAKAQKAEARKAEATAKAEAKPEQKPSRKTTETPDKE